HDNLHNIAAQVQRRGCGGRTGHCQNSVRCTWLRMERGFESVEALELGIAAAKSEVNAKQGCQRVAEAANETARKVIPGEAEQVEKAFAAVDRRGRRLSSISERKRVRSRL
ncbi:hypothetical protein, partial [Paracoccus sp. (in: a-proteobacteria)]|uniref:hypothetical protein n=1 Tax=Paracoccus sp. TaxID=267 RepID=UPI002AFED3B9